MKKILSLVIITIILSGCLKKEEDNKWEQFTDKFISEYLSKNPVAAVNSGLHDYDGMLGDYSPASINELIDWYYQQKKSAQEFVEEDLNDTQNFEREYLFSVIDKQLFWLKDAKLPFKNPKFYLDKIDPSVYLTREYAPIEVRMRSYIKYASNLPKVLEQMKNNLELPLPKTFAELGRNSFRGYVEFFSKDLTKIFISVKDEHLQKEFKEVNISAIDAAANMRDWFEELISASNGSFAMGSELYQKMLIATEGVNISLKELKDIAVNDLERNHEILKIECEKLAPGKSIQDCIEMVGKNKPDGGPVLGATKQLIELKKFVIDKDLVTIPSNEEALVAESPPYNRWNFAYIEIPGIYEHNLPSIYYISPPDPSWSEEDQQKYISGRAVLNSTSIHEVWPGHFLQALHTNQSKYKKYDVFWGYAYGEGWAHYTEEMMFEANYASGDPEYRIGQIISALKRNVRFLSSIGLHTEGMTVEESEKMFIEKGLISPGDAKQQSARGTFDPAYLNYTMGKLMILKLREDWTKDKGGREAWKKFHDVFLSFGSPPIPLVRKMMLNKNDGKLF